MSRGTNIRLMLVVRLKPQIEERLARLARQTGRTKTFIAREAILEHLENLEDGYSALKRQENPRRILTAQEVKRSVGL